MVEVWKGTHWFIEDDISDCFGSFDHDLMAQILAEKIHDGLFLRLISHVLKPGYLGGLAVERHAQQAPAGRNRIPRPLQRLP